MEERKAKEVAGKRRVEAELLDQGAEDTALTSWRIFRIMAEFVAGFELLRRYGLAATIFGSARDDAVGTRADEAYTLARLLSEDGFAVISGGGGGVMEAANRGAFDVGGSSVGLNIKLPKEQHLNEYTTDSETFHFFFTRKVALAFASEVYVFFPGGFGTLDEFFEITTLVQTKKIDRIPIVLVGRAYWEPLLGWIRASLYEEFKTVDEGDLELYHLVDSAEEAHEYIRKTVLKQ